MRVRPRVLGTLLGVVLLTAPSVLSGQRPYAWVLPVEEEVESSLEHPFAVLLAHSFELTLNESQVERIEGVRERLLDTNEPLLAQLRDAEVYVPEGEEEIRALEAVRDRFTANARSAETQVRTILGREQTEQARELIGHDSWAYPPEDEAAAGEADETEAVVTTLTVENHNYYDATVYIVAGPRRQRLGFVGGLKDETFIIPNAFIAAPTGIRLEVRQIPSYRLPLTDEVTVLPGNLVFLRIPPS